jgi:hypothetical protein
MALVLANDREVKLRWVFIGEGAVSWGYTAYIRHGGGVPSVTPLICNGVNVTFRSRRS